MDNEPAPRKPATDEEVERILAESRQQREQAHDVVRRADDTALDMTRMLRRIASAMERNPTTWDDLFRDKKS